MDVARAPHWELLIEMGTATVLGAIWTIHKRICDINAMFTFSKSS